MTQQAIQLLSRSCTVTVGTVQIKNIGQQQGLDVWFAVRRSLRAKEPNTCDLRLYNLSDASRKAIAASSSPSPSPASGPGAPSAVVPVKIEAGYVGGTSTIFLGEMRSAQTMTDGPNTVTEITTGDGDLAAILARSTASFGPGANAYVVAKRLLADMGLGSGNVESFAQVLRSSPLFNGGATLKGNSMARLIDLARSCALEVSLQNGVPQFVALGQPLGGQAYKLSSDSGLIGSPNVDTKGVLTCETLLLPGMNPGIPIEVDAKYVQGLYRVISVETTGDTSGNDWRHSIEARRYGTGLG